LTVWSLNPRNQVHKVSLFLFVIFENIGHIRPNCYLLKSHRLHRRHLSQEGKSFVLCKNANLKIAKPVKKYFNKQSQPTCHHCGVTWHIRPHYHQIRHQKPRIKKQELKAGKSSSKPYMPYHAFKQKWQYPQKGSPSCRHCGKYGNIKTKCFRVKPHKPKKN